MRTYHQTLKSLFVILFLGLWGATGCRHREWDISDFKITGITPKCDGERIAVNARITVSFSRKVDRASAQIQVYSAGNLLPGSITHDDTSMTFTPAVNFNSNSDYTWVIPATLKAENGGQLPEEIRRTCRTEDGVDTVPPVTTPSLAPGVYSSVQSVTLSCSDNFSGCQKIIYTTNGTVPTQVNGTTVQGNSTGAISLGMGENKIRYSAVDNAGNIAPYYEAVYSISTTGYLVAGTTSHFARGIGATPGHFEAIHSGQDQSRVFRDPVTTLLYVAANDGLFISNDNGATYTWRNEGGDSVYADRRTIVVANASGLGISTDGGDTFSYKGVAEGLLAVAASDAYVQGNTIYVTQSVHLGGGVYNGGFGISTNGGASFSVRTTANGLGSNGVFNFFVDGANIYVATAAGLSISTNSGASFVNRTTAHGLGSNSIQRVFASGQDIYVATASGLSISHNGGTSFANRTQANGLPSSNITAVHGYAGKIYAAFSSGAGAYSSLGIGVSSDGGLTFQNYGIPQGHLGIAVAGIFADSSAVYAATGMGLMKSANSGNTYIQDLARLSHYQVDHGAAVSGSHLYVGTTAALNYSQNGGTNFITLYAPHGINYTNMGQVQDVKICNGKVFVAMTTGLAVANVGVHNFTMKTTANGLSTNYVTKLYVDGNALYLIAGTSIHKTTDGGNSFSTIAMPTSNATTNLWVSGNEILLLSESEGIYRTINGGTNWTTFDGSNGNIFNSNGSYVPYGIFKEGNTIYYGTEAGLYVSTDNGGFFNQATGYTIFANNIINILRRDGILYLGAYNSNTPNPMAPYENILNWSADRVIFGTSPDQEHELGGLGVYGIERYLNPNGDG